MDGDNSTPSYEIQGGRKTIAELVKWMEAGADVVIHRDGVPVARVIPYVEKPDEGGADLTIHATDPKE